MNGPGYALLAALLLVVGCGGGSDGPPATTPSGSPTTAAGDVRTVPHRVLADGLDEGNAWTTRHIESSDELEGLVGKAEMDWESEVVFAFTLAESSSCPFDSVESLQYAEEAERMYPVVPLEGAPTECTADANPHTVVMAVPRSELPGGPFSLWVERDPPPAGVRDGVTRFEAGEVSTPEDRPGALGDEGDLAVGEVRVAYEVTTHCGLQRLYRIIGGRQWKVAPSEEDFDHVPAEWETAVREPEEIDLRVERTDPEVLEVTAKGTDHTVTYVPASDSVGCD